MRSHFLLLMLFAFFVSLVFAFLAKDDVGEQVRFLGKLFAGFLAAAVVFGWLMYPFPLQMVSAASRMSLWGPVILYLVFIFTLSSIANPPELPAGSDKNLHAVLYSGLAVLLARAMAGGFDRRVTLTVAMTTTILAGLYGVSDELHQYFVPPREVEVLDVIADTTGAAIAAFVLYAWGIIRNRHDFRKPSRRT